MNEQELIENYTAEQLATMVINLETTISDMKNKEENKKKELRTISDFLPAEPIKVADMLISAEGEYERNAIGKAFYGNDKGTYNLFDISELRQIAEHLLVYCNANGEGEE